METVKRLYNFGVNDADYVVCPGSKGEQVKCTDG